MTHDAIGTLCYHGLASVFLNTRVAGEESIGSYGAVGQHCCWYHGDECAHRDSGRHGCRPVKEHLESRDEKHGRQRQVDQPNQCPIPWLGSFFGGATLLSKTR
jgi:hypothetical protein